MQIRVYKKLAITVFILTMLFINVFSSSIFATRRTPTIYSPAVILMEARTGRILYERNMRERRYPASITKVMTSIIVLQNAELEERVTISYDAVNILTPGYVTANLQIGEELSVYQLLNIHMLTSANDASNALAEHVAGSIEEFSILMNEKAREIGATNTNFVNPTGVHHPNHYSTAYDLALIGQYAMQYDVFREIVRRVSFTLAPTNKHYEGDRQFFNTNLLILPNDSNRADNFFHRYATGMKTGFTTPAGRCLIASASRNNMDLITVVLGAGRAERYADTLALLNYAYNNYIVREIARQGAIIQTYNVRGGTNRTRTLDILVDEAVYVFASRDVTERILPEVNLNNLRAPIRRGEVVGTATYNVEGIEYTFNLIAGGDVRASRWGLMTAIFILSIGAIIKNNQIKRRKRKRLKAKHRKKK